MVKVMIVKEVIKGDFSPVAMFDLKENCKDIRISKIYNHSVLSGFGKS